MQNQYRPIKNTEHHFLEEMLYEALFTPKGQAKHPKSIIYKPEINKYIKNWSQKEGDIAIVATIETEPIAAVWGRLFNNTNKGYGFVDERTPEIAMAVKENHRNKGIGTQLLRQIEASYRAIGITQISLSVDKRNPAKMLYERSGYKVFEEAGTSIIMLKNITK